MDDALVLVALDVSGRGSLHYDVTFARHFLGELSTECVREFFTALSGHGHLDLASYGAYLAGELIDHELSDEMIAESTANLPTIPA